MSTVVLLLFNKVCSMLTGALGQSSIFRREKHYALFLMILMFDLFRIARISLVTRDPRVANSLIDSIISSSCYYTAAYAGLVMGSGLQANILFYLYLLRYQ